MNLSVSTLIAAARALDESRWHLERAMENPASGEPHAAELLMQTERALDEVEARYSAHKTSQPTLPEFEEWLGYSE